jgi:hypothetical protein
VCGTWTVSSLRIAVVALITAAWTVESWAADWPQPPPAHFETYDDLYDWAMTSSGHGGTLTALGPGEEGLYYSGRRQSPTSESRDSAVYRYEGASGGYRLVFYLPWEPYAKRLAQVRDGALVVLQWSASQPDTQRISVPLTMLSATRRPFRRDDDPMFFGDLQGFPDEGTQSVTREAALEIAREKLSDEGLRVHALQLRLSKRWGAVWLVESVRPATSQAPNSARFIEIDADTGEVLNDISWQWFIESGSGGYTWF